MAIFLKEFPLLSYYDVLKKLIKVESYLSLLKIKLHHFSTYSTNITLLLQTHHLG